MGKKGKLYGKSKGKKTGGKTKGKKHVIKKVIRPVIHKAKKDLSKVKYLMHLPISRKTIGHLKRKIHAQRLERDQASGPERQALTKKLLTHKKELKAGTTGKRKGVGKAPKKVVKKIQHLVKKVRRQFKKAVRS